MVGSCDQRVQVCIHQPLPSRPLLFLPQVFTLVMGELLGCRLPNTLPLCLCTLMETSGTRGRALGSKNGRVDGSVPS